MESPVTATRIPQGVSQEWEGRERGGRKATYLVTFVAVRVAMILLVFRAGALHVTTATACPSKIKF